MSTAAANATYLANVLSIAKVGGKVAASESLVVRSIIHRIGATQEDLVAAGRMLSAGNYQLTLPDDRHACVSNLQDMVMVALADGRVSPIEAGPIEKMAKLMHYSQADVDLVVKRAQLALSKIGKSLPERGEVSEIIPEVKAVPPLPPRRPPPPPSPPLPPPPPVAPVAPEESEESDVERDVESHPEPEPADDAPVPAPEVEPVAPPAAPPNRVARCMGCRSASPSPEAYCFGAPAGPLNPWGCRLSGLTWNPGAAWLSLGAFRDDDTFVFDKGAIAELLSENLSNALTCPHFSSKYAETAFSELPGRAVIGLRWAYRRAGPDDRDAETVTETRYVHGCAMSSLAAVRGVNPVGSRDALKIIRRAARRLGRDVTFCNDLPAD